MAIFAVFEVVSTKGAGKLVQVPVKNGTVPDIDTFLQEHYLSKNKKFRSACKSSPFLVEGKWDHEFFIKFVADDGHTHFSSMTHAEKNTKQLKEDWAKSLTRAKKDNFEWSLRDAQAIMNSKGWVINDISTTQLDY